MGKNRKCSYSVGSIQGKPLKFTFKKGKDKEFVSIRDTEKEKLLADNWEVVSKLEPLGYELMFLKNPVTGKIHLFNEETYGTKLDIFNDGYKRIDFLGDFLGTYPFVLTNDEDKCALYINTRGFVTGFKYDNIECDIRAIIFTKGKKKTFALAYDKNLNRSREYDEIKCDGVYIYCRNGGNCDVYLERHDTVELVFTTFGDSIKHLGKVELDDGVRSITKNVFRQKKDNKYGLLEVIIDDAHVEKTTKKGLVPVECDDIDLFSGTENVIGGAIICYLKKDKKYGLFGYNVDYTHQTKIKYDHIDMIYDRNIFALYTKDICDIYDLKNDKILITGCEEYEVIGDYIIYKKRNKKGIYSISDGSNEFGYDDVVGLGNNLFMVEKNGKKGLFHGTKSNGINKHIEPKYKSIRIGKAGKLMTKYDETLYLALEREDGDYELNLLNLSEGYFTDDQLIEPVNNIYKQIKFYEDFFVTEDSDGIFVSSYDGSVVKTFKPGTKVVVDKTDTKDGRQLDLIAADDDYYVLFNREFVWVDPEFIPEYEYSYTSDYGEVSMVFHSKSEYDSFIKSTGRLSKKDMDDIFIGLYEESPRAQEKYPKLMKQIGRRD